MVEAYCVSILKCGHMMWLWLQPYLSMAPSLLSLVHILVCNCFCGSLIASPNAKWVLSQSTITFSGELPFVNLPLPKLRHSELKKQKHILCDLKLKNVLTVIVMDIASIYLSAQLENKRKEELARNMGKGFFRVPG